MMADERHVCANPEECCRELSRVWEALEVITFVPGRGSCSEQVARLLAEFRAAREAQQQAHGSTRAARLRELAKLEAGRRHSDYRRRLDPRRNSMGDQPDQLLHPEDKFEVCPHPDCALVREPELVEAAPLNVDTVDEEVSRGHYSLLRLALAQRGEAGRRIMLEELCLLIRSATPPRKG